MLKFCGKKKQIQDTLWSVFTSFGYLEIEKDEDFEKDIKKAGKYCYFDSKSASAAESGEMTEKAYAEKAAMCIEGAIANGLDNFEVTVGDSDVFDLLVLFGFENMIKLDEKINGFVAVCGDKEFAKGCFKEDKCCSIFDMDIFTDVLESSGIVLTDAAPSMIFAEKDAEGFAYDIAYNLRVNGCIVEYYNGRGDIKDAEEYTKGKNITCILRVYADGKLEIKDFVKNEIIETTAEEFLGYYEDEEECGCGHEDCCGHGHHHGEDCCH